MPRLVDCILTQSYASWYFVSAIRRQLDLLEVHEMFHLSLERLLRLHYITFPHLTDDFIQRGSNRQPYDKWTTRARAAPVLPFYICGLSDERRNVFKDLR